MMSFGFVIFFIYNFLLLVSTSSSASSSTSHDQKRRVLILGGNGFLGSHLVRTLSESEDQSYHITVLNRGNVYFNSDKESLSYADKILTCDRNTLLRQTCPGLVGKSKYDAVIDFSSYTGQQVEQVIDILKGRVGVYVLISTDAVYEVTEKYHTNKTMEEDSRNEPKDQKTKDKLEKNNKYGASKKEVEERLFEQRDKLGFPYVVLRLADAIGEKDTSYRWWNYQLWMQLHQAFNATVSLPKGIKSHKFSMIYAKDVANVISSKILQDPEIYFDQIINLAFKEDITLTKVLDFMQNYYGLSDVLYDHDDQKGFFRYPTAERGAIDCSRADLLLDWNPTTFEEAATATCKFFDQAMTNPAYAKEREFALADFIEETLPESFDDERLFVDTLTNMYGRDVFRGIDIGLGDTSDPGFLLEAKTEL